MELYEASFDALYLQTALDLQQDMIKHFWDEAAGGFYFIADDAEQLLLRQKEIYDGAVPSGNAVAMLNLLRLSRITAQPDFEHRRSPLPGLFPEACSKRLQPIRSLWLRLILRLTRPLKL